MGRQILKRIPRTASTPAAPTAMATDNKLLRASVVPYEEGYPRVRKQQSQLGPDVEGELAIFAVDSAPVSSRSRSSAPSPPCGREAAFRGRPLSGGSPIDQAERARIHADLQAVGQALRP